MELLDRFQKGWNAFRSNRDPTRYDDGYSYSYRPDRPRLTGGNERSIVTSIINRIAMDVAQLDFKHVQLDSDARYDSDKDSDLNYCLTTEANVDQTGRQLIQDITMSMLDEGTVAVIPTDTDDDPDVTGTFKVLALRTGKIIQWKPKKVQVRVYDETDGVKKDIWVTKQMTAIIENPLYAVMNEKNSTIQRLVRKLNLLDAIDEQSGSGKMDLIIQLPYALKGTLKKDQANERRQEIEQQLTNTKYGIAYVDGTEHITQLNRPVDNNLMAQIEYLTNMAFGQLGITKGVMDGTASEEEMLNYHNRTIGPIATTICDCMRVKWLTKTTRTQGQTIMYFRDVFVMTTLANLAEAADKLTRNEIMSSNEVRQKMGMKPSKDPSADELRNKNLNKSESGSDSSGQESPDEAAGRNTNNTGGNSQNG